MGTVWTTDIPGSLVQPTQLQCRCDVPVLSPPIVCSGDRLEVNGDDMERSDQLRQILPHAARRFDRTSSDSYVTFTPIRESFTAKSNATCGIAVFSEGSQLLLIHLSSG